MTRDLKKLLLYPVLIYVIISLEVATIVLLGFDSDASWVWVVTTVFVTVLVFTFAFIAKPLSFRKGFIMGAVWAGFFILLDVFIVAVPFTGFSYFSDIRTWIPYFVGFIAPIIIGLTLEKRNPHNENTKLRDAPALS
jgi:hypothetical protein